MIASILFLSLLGDSAYARVDASAKARSPKDTAAPIDWLVDVEASTGLDSNSEISVSGSKDRTDGKISASLRYSAEYGIPNRFSVQATYSYDDGTVSKSGAPLENTVVAAYGMYGSKRLGLCLGAESSNWSLRPSVKVSLAKKSGALSVQAKAEASYLRGLERAYAEIKPGVSIGDASVALKIRYGFYKGFNDYYKAGIYIGYVW